MNQETPLTVIHQILDEIESETFDPRAYRLERADAPILSIEEWTHIAVSISINAQGLHLDWKETNA